MFHVKRRVLTRRAVWYLLQVFSTIVSWFIGNKLLMTSHDLRWPFPVSLSIIDTWIITDEIIRHSWSWKNWVVLTHLLEVGRISIFSHRLVMWRSWIWPDLRSQIYKFWDIQLVHELFVYVCLFGNINEQQTLLYHESDLTSGHRYRNSEIYKLCMVVPLWKPEERKSICEKL